MDYKGNGGNFDNLSSQIDSNEIFFTPGNGLQSPERNDSGDSVDSDAFQIRRNPQNIGHNAAIFSAETTPDTSEKADSNEAIDVSSNPATSTPVASRSAAPTQYEQTSVTQGDRVDHTRPIAAAMQTVKDLASNGQTSDFYNKIRGEGGLVEANLRDSHILTGDR